jgi:hypothetical protein
MESCNKFSSDTFEPVQCMRTLKPFVAKIVQVSFVLDDSRCLFSPNKNRTIIIAIP